MSFDGFEWDQGNREKCQKHGVSIEEIESVFSRAAIILPDKENPQGEQRFRAIGTTVLGCKVFIVFTIRPHSNGTLLRPISARYMHMKEVKDYEKDYPDV